MSEFPSLRLADYVLEWVTPEKCGLTAICPACGFHGVDHPAVHPCTASKHVCNARGWDQVPNVADVSNKLSLDIARDMLSFLGITAGRQWQARQTGGQKFEAAAAHFIEQASGLTVKRGVLLSEFAQYRHLRARRDDDMHIDIAASRRDVLVAALELKTTLRSDRARGAVRNLRAALTLHNGHMIPLAAILTAEPLPSRLKSVIPQTGDTYRVVHVAREALADAVGQLPLGKGEFADWQIAGPYVRDFASLTESLRGAMA